MYIVQARYMGVAISPPDVTDKDQGGGGWGGGERGGRANPVFAI
jgi:hypothetical protein